MTKTIDDMCLYPKQGELKIATCDIPCYKLITFDGDCFRSFFRHEVIPENIVNGKAPYIAEGVPEPQFEKQTVIDDNFNDKLKTHKQNGQDRSLQLA